jgi:predicted Zn-dependent peptidase
VQDVQSFFDTYYDPANASLVVAGDFERDKALGLVRARFESIPARRSFSDPGAPGFSDQKSTLTQVVRETIEDDVEAPKVVIAWQSPKHFGAGDADLDVAAGLLASGKSSRLYKTLVYDKKLAQSVDASQQSGVLGSRFVVSAVARKGVKPADVEAALMAEVRKLTREGGNAEELTRVKNGIEASFVVRLEGLRERASLLNLYQAERGDPGFAPQDLERYTRVDNLTVKATMQRVLRDDAHVVLTVVPRKEGAKP